MRGQRTVVVAVVACFLWLVAGAPALASGTVSDVGWWTRNPLASAPDGGFAAGAAADGPTTVSVVRIDLGDGVDTLVLGAEPTDGTAGLASLEVCVVTAAWSAAAGAPLDDAPQTGCDIDAVPFARAGDRWRADVSSLVNGRTGSVSLAVVPTATSGTVPFEASFGAPTAVAEGSSTPPDPSDPAPPGSAPPYAPDSSESAPPPSAGFRPAPLDAPAPAATPPDPPDAPEDPPASTTTTVATGPDLEVSAVGVLDESSAGGARWGEALVLILIGATVGGGVYGVSRYSEARS